MVASVTINARFLPTIYRLVDRRIGAGVRALRDICKAKVSTPYPPASNPGDPAHRRTGAYQRAIFASRVGLCDWVYGVREVSPDPKKPGSNRGWLGLWLELGTGKHRQPMPNGSLSVLPRGSVPMWFGDKQENTAHTGHRTSMGPRPVLLPTLVNDGPTVFAALMGGGP